MSLNYLNQIIMIGVVKNKINNNRTLWCIGQPYYMMKENGYVTQEEHLGVKGKIEHIKPKSYSIVAMNLETVDDVDKVIRQCELVKEEMTGELLDDLNLRQYLDVPTMNFAKSSDTGDYHKPVF